MALGRTGAPRDLAVLGIDRRRAREDCRAFQLLEGGGAAAVTVHRSKPARPRSRTIVSSPPSPPIPRSYDNKNMMILRGTLPVPLAQTAEGAPISSVFWGDRPSRKQIGYRMSLNAPLHHPIPYRRNPRRRTFPASFGISTWRRSRT